MARYSIEGPWDEEARRDVQDWDLENEWPVITETATLVDSQGGYRYAAGAYRVRFEGPNPKPRAKTFRGETAWSDAERYAGDMALAIQHGRVA